MAILSGFQDGVALTTVDMANAAHALVFDATPAAAQTDLVGRLIRCDPNGGAQTLTFSIANTLLAGVYWIVNTADAAETLTVNDTGAVLICSLLQNERAVIIADGVNTPVGIVGGST